MDGWIDFNGDGDWSDPGEKIFDSRDVVAGSNQLLLNIPADAKIGTTFARFRVSTAGGLSYSGTALDGEVEDYQINIAAVARDWGDAPPDIPRWRPITAPATPSSPDSTLARRSISTPTGGRTPRPPATTATDSTTRTASRSSRRWFRAAQATITVNVVNTSLDQSNGYLSAWIDFNRDNDFAGEQIFTDRELHSGDNTLTFNVPAGVSLGSTFARFRFSHEQGLSYDDVLWLGNDAPDGEVEDYAVQIVPPNNAPVAAAQPVTTSEDTAEGDHAGGHATPTATRCRTRWLRPRSTARSAARRRI